LKQVRGRTPPVTGCRFVGIGFVGVPVRATIGVKREDEAAGEFVKEAMARGIQGWDSRSPGNGWAMVASIIVVS